MKRILVTGSRDWEDRDAVWRELDRFTKPFVLVQGECATGADFYARQWARNNDVEIESHHADWVRHGRQAGPVRNRAMVKAGADVCIAFQKNGSKGTKNTVALCVDAGIPVHLFKQGVS